MFRILRSASQFRCGKYGTNLFTPVNLAFTALLLMTQSFGTFYAELQNSLMARSGVRHSWQYIASLCMVQRFIETLVQQLVTNVCCVVGLHCDAEGWSHLVTDHLFGPLQEQFKGRQLHGYEKVEITLCELLQTF
jgi:hypothetical protein